MTGATRWNDLAPRLTSALVMLGVGGVALALGGLWLRGLLALVCGAMIWEVIGLFAPHEGRRALALAAATAVAFFVATWLPISAAAIVMLLAIVLIYKCLPVKGGLLPAYGALVSAGAMGVFGLYIQSGLSAVIWLISLVIITDLAGYFAGRLLGGPKFWAAISPNKTWSGTVAGWLGAGCVGGIFVWQLEGVHWGIIPLSIVLSIVSQFGDIFESHLKRRAGVKDSSSLIPGHGGFLDRFDGMIAAAAVTFAVQIFLFPSIGF
ncbi:MAG TPA: phosphatidate cytidylyltransferase [Rhodobacteraceae bacterium]|jgi:phosphatidate cytidylyltransferase|nr:phosphatidate cytidylyltransferase [Paracoccaceae bacterium]|tara:strand:- start:23614 stop:24405 length:792 start_codon:yes stop_codon:yes gene_type:complete